MRPRDVRKYLFDMKEAGDLVGNFTRARPSRTTSPPSIGHVVCNQPVELP